MKYSLLFLLIQMTCCIACAEEPLSIDIGKQSHPFDFTAVVAALQHSSLVKSKSQEHGHISSIEPILFSAVYSKDTNRIFEHVVCRLLITSSGDPFGGKKPNHKFEQAKMVILSRIKYQTYPIWEISVELDGTGTNVSVMDLQDYHQDEAIRIREFMDKWGVNGEESHRPEWSDCKVVARYKYDQPWKELVETDK